MNISGRVDFGEILAFRNENFEKSSLIFKFKKIGELSIFANLQINGFQFGVSVGKNSKTLDFPVVLISDFFQDYFKLLGIAAISLMFYFGAKKYK